MDDAGQIFPATEYQARTRALQNQMAQRGQDALLLTQPADIFYASGFLTRFWESPARPWFIVVPLSGDPVAVIPSIGVEPFARTWLTDIRTWDAPDPVNDGVTLLVATLRDLTPQNATIGLPMGLETHLRMPLADHDRLTSAIAPRRWADATATVQRVREIKSDAEVAKIRATCAIADRAFAQVPQLASAGKPLDAVFRDFQIALLREGADWVSYTAGGAGPCGYRDVISPADNRPLAKGDIVMLDTGAVKDGYFCDFDRNYAIGHADDTARRAYDALFAATDAALATLKPGMLACDAQRIMADHLRGAGMAPLGGRLGHGLGVTLTEWPSFTTRDRTPLRTGMVLTLEPGVETTAGRIMVHEENIVLRASGCELLSTRAPDSLPVIP